MAPGLRPGEGPGEAGVLHRFGGIVRRAEGEGEWLSNALLCFDPSVYARLSAQGDAGDHPQRGWAWLECASLSAGTRWAGGGGSFGGRLAFARGPVSPSRGSYAMP